MPTLRTILFAADFSENSVDAFRLACSMAARDEALLIVLHVIDPAQEGGPRPSPELEALAASRESRMREVYVTDRPVMVAYRTSARTGRGGDPPHRRRGRGGPHRGWGRTGAPACAA